MHDDSKYIKVYTKDEVKERLVKDLAWAITEGNFVAHFDDVNGNSVEDLVTYEGDNPPTNSTFTVMVHGQRFNIAIIGAPPRKARIIFTCTTASLQHHPGLLTAKDFYCIFRDFKEQPNRHVRYIEDGGVMVLIVYEGPEDLTDDELRHSY